MSNIDKITANQQLFIELIPEQVAIIEGGTVYVTNTLNCYVDYQYFDQASQKWTTNILAPGQQFSSPGPIQVYFDHRIGAGETYIIKQLYNGCYAFESKDGEYLELNYKEGGNGGNVNNRSPKKERMNAQVKKHCNDQ